MQRSSSPSEAHSALLVVMLVLVTASLLAGCSANQPTSNNPQCQADSDCALTTQSVETCCSTCEETPMTTAEHAALREGCADDVPDDCPQLDCPFEGDTQAACQEGRCVRVTP